MLGFKEYLLRESASNVTIVRYFCDNFISCLVNEQDTFQLCKSYDRICQNSISIFKKHRNIIKEEIDVSIDDLFTLTTISSIDDVRLFFIDIAKFSGVVVRLADVYRNRYSNRAELSSFEHHEIYMMNSFIESYNLFCRTFVTLIETTEKIECQTRQVGNIKVLRDLINKAEIVQPIEHTDTINKDLDLNVL